MSLCCSGSKTPEALKHEDDCERVSGNAAYLDPACVPTISDIAHSEGADIGDVSRSLPLAFLAPDLVDGILNGTQPIGLTAERLKRVDLPLLWEDQHAVLA
jgi:hypothetical protein